MSENEVSRLRSLYLSLALSRVSRRPSFTSESLLKMQRGEGEVRSDLSYTEQIWADSPSVARVWGRVRR